MAEEKDIKPSEDDGELTWSEKRELTSEEKIRALSPPDTFYSVFFIFLLHGVGMLMSWNMFITIAPQYYVDYWFSGNGSKYQNSFMSVLGVTSQIPNCGIMFFNAAIVAAGSLMLRIVVPLIFNCFLVAVIIFLVIFVHPDADGSNVEWFYIVTLVIIMLMNLCNGIYQSSVYGISADFPDNYINALVIGNNLCGVFTSLMSIFTTLISPNDIELNALLYFSISLAILIFCLGSLAFLVKMPFYKYFMTAGEMARKQDDAETLSLKQYWECFSYCWVQLFNNFFVYFVSLAVFPAMLTDTQPFQSKCPYVGNMTTTEGSCNTWDTWIPENIYYSINTYLNFNVFAFIGSSLANYFQFPSAKWLWIPISFRILFLPFFMLCNYRPDSRKWTVIFSSNWWPVSGCAVLAFTCGYFSSLALIYTPSVVPASYQKISGMAASIALMLGILAGVSFTPLLAAIVEHW